MLASELRSREQRLLSEQKERLEKERQRRQREEAIQERLRQKQLERVEEQRSKRLAELAAQEAERERFHKELQANNGVHLEVQLMAVPADHEAARAKGIKRLTDKITLPASVGASLMAQDAPKNGAQLFEISTPDGKRRTHAGVLEFTAAEGTVALPRKVLRSLWGVTSDGAMPLGASPAVVIRYRLLEKATFVRFQPMTRGFHEAVGDDVRAVLEGCLLGCSTLTQGDWLEVEHAGQTFDLQVQELRPQAQASILDTDVEAEVVPSLESEQALAQYEQEQRRVAEAALKARQLREQLAREAEEAARAAEVAAEEAARAAAAKAVEEQQRKERQRREREAMLPAEPDAAEAAARGLALMAAVVRLPDGSRVTRRFVLDQPLQLLYEWVDAKGAGGLGPGSYQLVTSFPRKVLPLPGAGPSSSASQGLDEMDVDGAAVGTAVGDSVTTTAAATAAAAAGTAAARRTAGLTLAEVGLKAGQEAFFLEPLA